MHPAGAWGIRPLRPEHHVQACVGSPPLTDAAIPGRLSDIKSALAPLRIPKPYKQNGPPTFVEGPF